MSGERAFSLRERAALLYAGLMRRLANACLRGQFLVDLSRRKGKTTRPGRSDSMSQDEVVLFAFLHGIAYPATTGGFVMPSGVTAEERAQSEELDGGRPEPVYGPGTLFVVSADAEVVDATSGFCVTLRAGKVISEGAYDVGDLRRQGVLLYEKPPTETRVSVGGFEGDPAG